MARMTDYAAAAASLSRWNATIAPAYGVPTFSEAQI